MSGEATDSAAAQEVPATAPEATEADTAVPAVDEAAEETQAAVTGTEGQDEEMAEATTEEEAAAAAAAPSDTLADLMDDGVDELAEEQVRDDAEAAAVAAEAAEADAAAAAEEDEDGDDGGEGGGSADVATADPVLVASLREHLKLIFANLDDATKINKVGVKGIMKQLKKAAGKKVIKANKELAKVLAKEAAQARLDMVQSASGAAAEEEEEEDAEVPPPVGDVEGEDYDEEEEEEEQPKKSRKRLRKAGSDDEDDDDDYSEKRAAPKKKAKKDDSKKKSGNKDAAASSSSTAALLSIPMPKTAFVIFQRSERPKMKEEHPDANSGEIQKLISEKWAALDVDSKSEYDNVAKAQKTAYREALLQLQERDPAAYAAHMRAAKKTEQDLMKDPIGKKKKGKESRGSDYDDDPDDGHDPDDPPKELTYFDSIVSDLKSRRATKSELSPEEQKAVAEAFISRMEDAVKADITSVDKGEPAVARLKMLADVQAQVSKPRVAELLLDEGLLRVLTKWIAPEADGTLPNVKLRSVVYGLLSSLNINEQNLASSRGLGKRVMRLWKDPEETIGNKRLLEALIQKWMRPMLGLSTDYAKLSEVDQERGREILDRKSLLDSQKPQHNYNPKRAMMPQQARFDYAIRPQANREHDDEAEEARDASKAKRLEPESRKEALRKKMDKMKRGANQAKPKFRVDITGRASNY